MRGHIIAASGGSDFSSITNMNGVSSIRVNQVFFFEFFLAGFWAWFSWSGRGSFLTWGGSAVSASLEWAELYSD